MKKTLLKNKFGTPLKPKIFNSDHIPDANEFNRLKGDYEDLLTKYASASEAIDMLNTELKARDITINNLLLSKNVAIKSAVDKKEQFDEHQIEVKALKEDIELLSRQNLKLEENLNALSKTSVQKNISSSHLKSPQPTGANESSVCYLYSSSSVLEPSYHCSEFHGAACVDCVPKSVLNRPHMNISASNIPSSLVAHWNPILPDPPYSISACATLRAHYVRLPNPGEIFYTAKDIVEEMKELLAKQERHADNCKQS